MKLSVGLEGGSAIVLGGDCPGGVCPRWELASGLLLKGQLSGGKFS